MTLVSWTELVVVGRFVVDAVECVAASESGVYYVPVIL